MASCGEYKMLSYDDVKRGIDFTLSFTALVFLAPLLLLIAFLVFVFLGKPILFYQLRPGKNGKPFNLLKFRSMLSATDAQGNVLPDDERINRFGLLLRRSSLDELPSLLNVLRGDMSMVGPRPLLMEYLPLYSEEQYRRHDVRPGITGLAQVNGRNSLSWSQKFDWDITYVETRSFLLDLKILFKTVITVLSRKGVSAGGVVGMEKFEGNQHINPGANSDIQ